MSYQRGIKQESEQPKRSITICVAHDCPLPATFSSDNGKTHFCRAHDGTPATTWPITTERVRKVERAFNAALDLTNATVGDLPPESIVAKFVAMSPEFAPNGKMSARTYGAFVLGKLLERVRPQSSPAPDLSSLKPKDTWQHPKVDILV